MPPERPQEEDSDFTFVKLYRRSITSQVFQNAELWKVFCWCIMRANYKESWVPVTTGRGSTEVLLQPGQFIFGRKEAAKTLRMKPSSVHDRIQKLRDMQNIVIQPDTHYSIITITNWELYQIKEDHRQQATRQASNNQPTTNQQPTNTDKNVKNQENVKKGRSLSNTNTRDHHFSDDPFFNFEVFFEATRSIPTMQGWPRQKCVEIHQAMADWSASRSGNKRSDWLAVARTFAKRDSLSMQVDSAGPRPSQKTFAQRALDNTMTARERFIANGEDDEN